VLANNFQHLAIAAHSVVLIVPTKFRAQDPELLADGLMAIGFTPFGNPAQEAPQPLAQGLALEGPSEGFRLEVLVHQKSQGGKHPGWVAFRLPRNLRQFPPDSW
jgi:hypothetical protein